MITIAYIAVAGIGLIFGSFFNVCIYRIPRGESLCHRSRCPGCRELIRWHDNIPVLSFILLRRKCRQCGEKISWRYPLVELSTLLLFVLIYWWSRNIMPGQIGVGAGVVSPELLIGLLMVSVLIVATWVDLEHWIVPNKAVYPGSALMLVFVIGASLYRGEPWRIIVSMACGLAAGGFMLLVGLVYGAVFMRQKPAEETDRPHDVDQPLSGMRGVEPEKDEDEVPTGIGMGDVKLVTFFSMALGYVHWYFVPVGVMVGFLFGAIASIFFMVARKKGRKEKFQFAPFLSAGALITMIWGQNIVDLYLRLLR